MTDPLRKPVTHRFAMKPVSVQLGNSRKKVNEHELRSQEGEIPERHALLSSAQSSIEGPSCFSTNEDHEERENADQVKVIEILRLFEEKEH